MFEVIFVGIVLLIIAGLAFFKPEVIWFITESWKSSVGSEPSDFYLITTRIGGVILLIVALILLIPGIYYSLT
ncbi:hypothetical protein CN692_05385 [Bacillus sp. AFS002410]|uniref:DUF6199 family natural product biosynthesis protein n=1 Tax=Bacillus sp. AFS002410 TaxID=2033481 RepID=UPI000BF1F336|nr:DUF6199 family natural product biosynthesis protein [Bacillus sp. AFS002410]PEJ59621.1 hypothetical protein CN692_05385 [Bacillus sp. AFS002410]